ncbi:MAG: hypothetical protein Q7K55_04830 [Candidatus Levybacteria bacterium]|nr:hypothetical protein [Candidatus Levybacteria bacterium]
MSEAGFVPENVTGLRSNESVRTTVERKVKQVVGNVRNNEATKKVALASTGGLIFFSTACGIGRPPEITPTPPAWPSPTAASQAGELSPKQPLNISIGSRVERNPSNSSIEIIKFQFPEGIIDGNSPLISTGDTLSVAFNLKSTGIAIRSLNIALSDLLGINTTPPISYSPNVLSGQGIFKPSEYIDSLLNSAKRNNQILNIDEAAKKVISKIQIGYNRSKDGNLRIDMSFPNEDFRFSDKNGTHSENPAKRFLSGKAGLGINRQGDTDKAAKIITANFPLKTEQFLVLNKGKIVARANDLDIISPQKVNVESNATKSPTAIAPTIVENKTTTPKNNKEASRWTEQKWTANQTVPLKEWWDDMVAKRYIKIDSVAQQYAGDIINNLRNNSNLVPNPVKYYEQHYGFVGNCRKSLEDLVQQGQGHIQVTPEAYSQIPGADNCDIFRNKK